MIVKLLFHFKIQEITIEKALPEKIRNKTDLESEIEMLKIKVSLVKSNVDDLNEEVCQN